MLTLHNAAESVQNGLRSKVLRRNKVDKMLLTVLLVLNDFKYGRVGLLQIGGKKLRRRVNHVAEVEWIG